MSGPSDTVTVADVAGRDRSIGIFTRLMLSVGSLASDLRDPNVNVTILAPSNASLTALPRKPWEDVPDKEATAHDTEPEEGRAQKNLSDFVRSHVVTRSPWSVDERAETLTGKPVWYEENNGRRVLKPDNIVVSGTSESLSNGQIWTIEGTLRYE